jgi:RNA 2',3'-cyclic 3'-phosphodiesterase
MSQRAKETSEPWRLFIAIELPAEIRRRIKQHIDRLRAELPEVRASWVREQNLHLTLKFFGDTPIEKVERVSRALQTAATGMPQFELRIYDRGSFPPRGSPSVLWIGIEDPSRNLNKLHEALENECERAGFARDARSFHPHLTIARLRGSQGARNLAELHKSTDLPAFGVRVQDVCLIRSELSSAGSRYTVVARHELIS